MGSACGSKSRKLATACAWHLPQVAATRAEWSGLRWSSSADAVRAVTRVAAHRPARSVGVLLAGLGMGAQNDLVLRGLVAPDTRLSHRGQRKAESVLRGVRLVALVGLGVAAMAVLTPQALLPVNVRGKALWAHAQAFGLRVRGNQDLVTLGA